MVAGQGFFRLKAGAVLMERSFQGFRFTGFSFGMLK
jgi:hypothetical protein